MTLYRIVRTKRGDLRLDLMDPQMKDTWYGFGLTDEEARQLAKDLCKAVTPTASDLTADKTVEP
jgi:hypothetical protein